MYAGPSGCALRVRELRAVGDAVDDEAAVGGVDHVGQAVDRVDELHVVAEADVGVVQHLPLREGERRVGGLGGVHPRVDPVDDGEVLGAAHEHAASGGPVARAGCPAARRSRSRSTSHSSVGRRMSRRSLRGDISAVGNVGGPGRSCEPRRRRSGERRRRDASLQCDAEPRRSSGLPAQRSCAFAPDSPHSCAGRGADAARTRVRAVAHGDGVGHPAARRGNPPVGPMEAAWTNPPTTIGCGDSSGSRTAPWRATPSGRPRWRSSMRCGARRSRRSPGPRRCPRRPSRCARRRRPDPRVRCPVDRGIRRGIRAPVPLGGRGGHRRAPRRHRRRGWQLGDARAPRGRRPADQPLGASASIAAGCRCIRARGWSTPRPTTCSTGRRRPTDTPPRCRRAGRRMARPVDPAPARGTSPPTASASRERRRRRRRRAGATFGPRRRLPRGRGPPTSRTGAAACASGGSPTMMRLDATLRRGTAGLGAPVWHADGSVLVSELTASRRRDSAVLPVAPGEPVLAPAVSS